MHRNLEVAVENRYKLINLAFLLISIILWFYISTHFFPRSTCIHSQASCQEYDLLLQLLGCSLIRSLICRFLRSSISWIFPFSLSSKSSFSCTIFSSCFPISFSFWLWNCSLNSLSPRSSSDTCDVAESFFLELLLELCLVSP